MFLAIFKANPYHDKAGRFTTNGGANFISSWGKEYAKASLKEVPKQAREYPDLLRTPGKETSAEYYKLVARNKAHLNEIGYKDLSLVRDYTGTGYASINHSLRVGNPTLRVRRIVAKLDAVIGANQVGVDTKAYRGVGGYNAYASKIRDMAKNGTLKPGTVFTEDGFSSTSLDKGLARKFAGHGGVVFHLNVPKEAKGIYVGMQGTTNKNKYSKHPEENELIMHRKGSVIVKKYWEDAVGTLNVEADWHVPLEEEHPANDLSLLEPHPSKQRAKKNLGNIFDY